MSNNIVLKGPWKNTRPDTITRVFSTSNYKLLNFFDACHKQEMAYNNKVFLVIYVMNHDYNRTFLISGTQKDVEHQISERNINYEEVNKIKASLNHY